MARKPNPRKRAAQARAQVRLSRALELLTGGHGAARTPAAFLAADLQRRASAWLGGAGVQGIGVGHRTVAGKQTRELVLKVFVDRKLPLDKVAQPVPKRVRVPGLREEITLDVEEIGRIGCEHAAGGPAAPGDGIGLEDPDWGTGTLGCLVRGEDGAIYVLSNAHVIGADGVVAPGTPVLRPSGEQGGTMAASLLARFARAVPLVFTPDGFYNVADAAIARVEDPARVTTAIRGIGNAAGVGPVVRIGDRICASGAASGYAEGTVKAVDFRFATDYRRPGGGYARAGFRGQVLCTSYTRHGDSGAVVLDTQRRIVGLHFAGSNDGPNPCSVFSPIGPVLAALNVEVVVEDARLPPTPPGAAAVAADAAVRALLPALTRPHDYAGSVRWQLGADGLAVGGRVEVTVGAPRTVGRVWDAYSASIVQWAQHFGVPVELIVATICTESGGDPKARRQEPGYVSDESTPRRVSVGLMQTLISTARESLGSASLDAGWLEIPDHSIQAGTAYIDAQRGITRLDPPKVACAYNAGGIYANSVEGNRWRMRQYPAGSSAHADRFVRFFNDCFRLFRARGAAPATSFWSALRE